MDAQFNDRLLKCADCHGEFIFTAGEQLFFLEKQFKNDPKRCKPCKSRRTGLAAVANGTGPAAAGLSRTETRTTCSECSVETTVPFKPTQGRPVLCRQCFQARARSLPSPLMAATPLQAAAARELGVTKMTTASTLSALTEVSANADGAVLSASAALVAVSSMASASPRSCVASAADLASISGGVTLSETTAELIPAEMLAVPTVQAELRAARVERDA